MKACRVLIGARPSSWSNELALACDSTSEMGAGAYSWKTFLEGNHELYNSPHDSAHPRSQRT